MFTTFNTCYSINSNIGPTLTVSGERIDEDPATEQTLKRSFSRKYSIPTDILLDSIRAHLTDFGLLLIRVSFKNKFEIAVDGLHNEDPHLNASFPTLYTSPLTQAQYLGQPQELAGNRNSNRSDQHRRGAVERRTKEAQRPVNCSRSAPSSPTPNNHHQHNRRRSTYIGDPREFAASNNNNGWPAITAGTDRCFTETTETTTRTCVRSTSRSLPCSTALPTQQIVPSTARESKAITRIHPEERVGIRQRLRSVDTESTLLSEHEESFI